jgi:hypothetical protein
MAFHLALDEWAASIPEKSPLATDKALWSAACRGGPHSRARYGRISAPWRYGEMNLFTGWLYEDAVAALVFRRLGRE